MNFNFITPPPLPPFIYFKYLPIVYLFPAKSPWEEGYVALIKVAE